MEDSVDGEEGDAKVHGGPEKRDCKLKCNERSNLRSGNRIAEMMGMRNAMENDGRLYQGDGANKVQSCLKSRKEEKNAKEIRT